MRSHRMTRSNLTSILGVVVEILFRQDPVLVTDESIGSDRGWVELDLDFDILGDGHECSAHLFDEHLLGFSGVVDVVVVSVSLIRDRLHHLIVQIAASETEDRQEDSGLGLLLRPFVRAPRCWSCRR